MPSIGGLTMKSSPLLLIALDQDLDPLTCHRVAFKLTSIAIPSRAEAEIGAEMNAERK
jgi:hypothetical protein